MGVNGIDMALVQEPCYRDDYITDLNISGYTPYSTGEKENLEPVTLRGKWMHGGCQDSLVGTLW